MAYALNQVLEERKFYLALNVQRHLFRRNTFSAARCSRDCRLSRRNVKRAHEGHERSEKNARHGDEEPTTRPERHLSRRRHC